MGIRTIRALFVEDEPTHGKGFADNLRYALRDACELQVEFDLVATVEEAKERLPVGQDRYPLVVTDMLFPGLGVKDPAAFDARGIEVIHQARRTPGVVVVAISQGSTDFPRLYDRARREGGHIFRYKQEITETSREGGNGWENLATEICQELSKRRDVTQDSDAESFLDEKSVKERVVMVVHGRREALVQDLFAFLRSLGLEPMEWEQLVSIAIEESQTGGNPDILTIVRTGFAHAYGCVVLFSPDDEARVLPDLLRADDESWEKALSGQPRQNVLLEAGYALGFNMQRTLIVSVGRLRPVSDLAGKHVVHLDNSTAKRKAVAQRLKTMGFTVVLEGEHWLTTGNFELP